ncbi:hypothetical protein C266_02411 [Pandoraea sp. SD6-2]|nr:hypothetical protein C266_02411 [Pandoraea sp. SD6-2]
MSAPRIHTLKEDLIIFFFQNILYSHFDVFLMDGRGWGDVLPVEAAGRRYIDAIPPMLDRKMTRAMLRG